jgi:hypothetical protein
MRAKTKSSIIFFIICSWLSGLFFVFLNTSNWLKNVVDIKHLYFSILSVVPTIDFSAITENILVLFVFILINAICFVYGHVLLNKLGFSYKFSIERAVHSFSIGYIFLFLIFAILGALNLYLSVVCWTILFFSFLGAAFLVVTNIKDFKEHYKFTVSIKSFDFVILCMVVVLFGFLLIATYKLPYRWDEIAYNLYFPKEYIARNGLPYIEEFGPYSSFPSYTEMSYIAGLLLGWEHKLPHLFSWGFTLLLSMSLIIVAGKFYLKPKYYLVLVFSLIITYTIVEWAPIAKNDIVLCLFQLLGLHSILLWKDNNEIKHLILSGVYIGVSFGIKFTGLYVFLSFIVLIFIFEYSKKKSFYRIIFNLSLFCLVALILVSPWLIRNTINVGNPVFPVATELIGGGGSYPFSEENRKIMSEIYENKNFSFRDGSSLSSNFSHLFDLLFHKDGGPWIFLFFPLFLLMSWGNILALKKNQSVLLLLIAVNLFVWVLLQFWSLRYNLFFFMMMLISSSIAIQNMEEKFPRIRFLIIGIVSILFLNSFGHMLALHGHDVIKYTVTSIDKRKFIQDKTSFGMATNWINDHLPKEARIYSSFSPLYYSDRTYILQNGLTEYGGFATIQSSDVFYERLKALSISYIAYKDWSHQVINSAYRPGKGMETKKFYLKINEFVNTLIKMKKLNLLKETGGIKIYHLSE